MGSMQTFFDRISASETRDIATIRNIVLSALQDYTREAGFYQILPILMSPITDPLNHAVYPAEIDYEGRPLKLTASMIFHKQLMLASKQMEKIFVLAPNIRLEKATVKSSQNHLLEFSQFDFEMKNASMYDVMAFIDGLVKYVFSEVREKGAANLKNLGRELPEYQEPFPIYSTDEMREKHGEDFENIISKTSSTPVFLTNFKREFYDRETPGSRGVYSNFDLIYPEGYGEALSGAEREFEHDQIVYRMNELDMDMAPYENYLNAAKDGLIPQTAGAGIGIERMLRFITGRDEIRDVSFFDRSISSDFAF
ncbi:asparagine synthetase A [Marinobacter nauticus]|uniref:asparagine synthetase A n=1 Tax=Marinobacter nauticus TaxID=2743 RepID=UPI004043E85F